MLNLTIYSCSNALPEWCSFLSATQMGSNPSRRNKEYAAAVMLTMKDYVSCLEGAWYGCFASGFSMVQCICCRQREAKLQERQELSTESIHKIGTRGNQNGEHILSHPIQSPITVYSQITNSSWQIHPVLLQALLGFLSTPPNLFEVCSGTSLTQSPKIPLISIPNLCFLSSHLYVLMSVPFFSSNHSPLLPVNL